MEEQFDVIVIHGKEKFLEKLKYVNNDILQFLFCMLGWRQLDCLQHQYS